MVVPVSSEKSGFSTKATGTNRPTNSNLTQDKLGKKTGVSFCLVFTPLTNNTNSGRFGRKITFRNSCPGDFSDDPAVHFVKFTYLTRFPGNRVYLFTSIPIDKMGESPWNGWFLNHKNRI